MLNLENESNIQTYKHTYRGFLGCLEILSDLIIRFVIKTIRFFYVIKPSIDRITVIVHCQYLEIIIIKIKKIKKINIYTYILKCPIKRPEPHN